MAASGNVAPVIIKRKKVVGGDGHHGGAWKVAYADFVTAMMAFFMLMWLLNATTENQRKGLADYFAPSIPINRVSGGGDDSFNGDSVFAEDTLPQNGSGATNLRPTDLRQASGATGMSSMGGDAESEDEAFKALESELLGRGGESMVSDELQRHIVTRVTDEGLVIEMFALEDSPLFVDETAEPTALLKELTRMVARVSALVTNDIAAVGHVRAQPIVLANNPAWQLSSDRAETVRQLLGQGGLPAHRMRRVTGHADRKPVVSNPMALRNERVEVVLLRY